MSIREATILVVEDEPIVGMEIMEQLSHTGYYIPEIVQNGDEVLDAVQRTNPDLVLMDIKIEGSIDGIEAARRIKSDFDIPVLFMTAFSDIDTVGRAASALPEAYLVKPFDERELLANVHVALEKSRARRMSLEDLTAYVPVVDGLNDPICLFDEDGRFFHANLAGQRTLGVPAADGSSGFWLSDFIPEIQHLADTVLPATFQVRAIGGARRPGHIRIEPITDKSGNRRGVIGFVEPHAVYEKGLASEAGLATAQALISLLPADGYLMPAINSAGFLEPSVSGSGDLYDIFAIDDDRYVFYSLDVMGHGTLPSLIAYSLHQVIRMVAKAEGQFHGAQLSPMGILAALNRSYFQKSGTGTFFTITMGVLDLSSGGYALARAGHTKTIIQRIDGPCVILESKGMALGAFDSISIEELRGTISRGERVVLCSDGLIEALGKGELSDGYTRLADIIDLNKRFDLEFVVDEIRRAFREHPVRQEDDASLLVVEIPAGF